MSEGTLTVDQAVAELIAPASEAPEPEQEAPAEAASDDTEQPAEPTTADDASEAEEPGDGEEAEPKTGAAAEPVEAPQWWDADAKDHFSKLTPEAQAVVFAQEEKREAVVQKAKAEASETRKAADAELQKVSLVSRALENNLPQLVEAYNSYWGPDGQYDLEANIAHHGLEQAMIFKSQHEKQQQALHEVLQAKKEADHQQLRAFQRAEFERLKEVSPELADPREGKTKLEEVYRHMLENDATPEMLDRIPAKLVALANDGLKYRKAQAEARTKAKAPLKPVAPALKPSAAQTPSTTSEVTKLKQRLAKTGSVDDAVALMLAEQSQAQRRA